LPNAPLPLLFDSAFLGKLEQLYLLSKRVFRGDGRAERRSRQTGSSLEFADYRNYVLGDDLRSVDWNIYGRLDRLFVKLFEHEQDLHLYFLIDASASMHWQPERAGARSKLAQACHLAASLAYVGLASLDRVDLLWFGPDLAGSMGVARGKAQFHQVLEFLRHPPAPAGPTRLTASVRSFAQRTHRRGLVFLLSDLFDPEGFEEALNLLRYEQFETHVIQLLDPAELAPEATGDLRLVDPETGASLDLTADETLVAGYRREMDAFLDRAADYCARRGHGYARAFTDQPFEDVVLRTLREGFILR
jgi:uncharacterized protein (DUF58 family)